MAKEVINNDLLVEIEEVKLLRQLPRRLIVLHPVNLEHKDLGQVTDPGYLVNLVDIAHLLFVPGVNQVLILVIQLDWAHLVDFNLRIKNRQSRLPVPGC